MSVRLEAAAVEAPNLAAAIELCYRDCWTDGLPVVPAAPEAVERVIAYNCVMARCLPEYLAIVIAAV